MIDTAPIPEKALLVGIATPKQSYERTLEYLEELAFLVETAGGIPVRNFIQKLEYADPRTYVGKGKLTEINDWLASNPVDVVIFDDELSPGQLRNIERVLNHRILDRNNLILDIFARRARTSYART